jgi:hypothetical protein
MSVALGCGLPQSLAPVAAGIALHENPRLDTDAVNRNVNGTADRGLTQVNTINDVWLSIAMHRPINDRTILDVCTNLEAGLRVLFVHYNGNPPPTVAAAYSTNALAAAKAVDALRVADIATAKEIPRTARAECAAPAWDTWGQAECRDREAEASPPKSPDPDKTGDQK